MKIIDEFKAFAIKGNALDLAVGVIIGAAFGKIVNSLVQDVFNPVIGMLIGGVDMSDLNITLKKAVEANPAEGIAGSPAVMIKIGTFMNMCVEFLIVAWAVFMLIKVINKLAGRSLAADGAPKA
ncbi:MAG: large-conductance mechanosensitive channel protein MscL [Planctomycetota bacterium]|jgi:large conductance mechanosensitive channel